MLNEIESYQNILASRLRKASDDNIEPISANTRRSAKPRRRWYGLRNRRIHAPRGRISTARQIESNRNNARSSTGPRTRRGRARASRNARRHGLSVSVVGDPRLTKRVEELARYIAGENARPGVLEMACRFAEAQIDLDRIRRARCQRYLLAMVEGTGSEPRSGAGRAARLQTGASAQKPRSRAVAPQVGGKGVRYGVLGSSIAAGPSRMDLRRQLT